MFCYQKEINFELIISSSCGLADHFDDLQTINPLNQQGSMNGKSEKILCIAKENNLRLTFVNVEIVLHMYLSNCTEERSCSKMKLIKIRFNTSMVQKRLTSLRILSIEIDIAIENAIEVF